MRIRSLWHDYRNHPMRRRRGASLMLTAVLLPVLLALVTIAIDTAVLAVARAQLKTVADAAALAGAFQLADEARVQGQTNLTTEITNAQTRARIVAQANLVLGQQAVMNANPGNVLSGDLVIGAVNPLSNIWSAPPLSDPLTTNAVMASATRDANHGSIVPTFFGRYLGFTGSQLTMQSTAMVQNYTISGFKTINNGNVNLLPIVLDSTTYNKMLTNNPLLVTDQFNYNEATNQVLPGPDGVYESKLFPVISGSPGNWGTVNIGVSSNSTSTLSDQIQYGITPAQMATYPNSTISLSTSTSPASITFGGDPGISAGIQDALTSIIGKAVTIPIYDQVAGDGNNTTYRVIGFAAVRVLSVNFQGDPKFVIVQPALLNDASVIPGTAQQTWTSGGVIRVHLTK